MIDGHRNARQYSDQVYCPDCQKTWDMNDPYPPLCAKVENKYAVEDAMADEHEAQRKASFFNRPARHPDVAIDTARQAACSTRSPRRTSKGEAIVREAMADWNRFVENTEHTKGK